jgi:hypothetical protein
MGRLYVKPILDRKNDRKMIYIDSYRYNTYSSDAWINAVIIDYFFTKNPHFSNSFRSWGINYFLEILDPNYVDNEGTGYYYNTFGPSGLNQNNSDFLIIWKWTGELGAARNLFKTGAILRHNFGGAIFNQNNMPVTTTYLLPSYYVRSSTDGFSGITWHDMDYLAYDNKFTGTELSNLQMPLVSSFRLIRTRFTGIWPPNINLQGVSNQFNIQSNSFTGELSTKIAGVTTHNIQSNSFTSVTNFDFISTNLQFVVWISNALDQTTVDSLFAALNTYFSTHTPTKNLAVSTNGGTSASPTGGSSNTDLVNLRDVIYPAAGFIFTATIN